MPPYEIIGNGAPTTGMSPIAIAMLMKKCKKRKEFKPVANNFEK